MYGIKHLCELTAVIQLRNNVASMAQLNIFCGNSKLDVRIKAKKKLGTIKISAALMRI